MQRLVLIWLYYTSPFPTSNKLSLLFPYKPLLKRIKKEKIKMEKKIKEEKDIKLKLTRGYKRLHKYFTKPSLVGCTNIITCK